MANFPDNPSIGSTTTISGISYTYNGSAWDGSTSSSSSSGSTGGGTTLPGDAQLIDSLLPAGTNPETLTNWYSYFQHIGDNGGTWVLPQRVYNIISSTPVTFKVSGTVLTGESVGQKPLIVIHSTSSSAPTVNSVSAIIPCGFWFANKSQLYNIVFTWSNAGGNESKALVLFQKAYTNYSVTINTDGSETQNHDSFADMDSTIRHCQFISRANLAVQGSGSLTYLGRNCRISDCAFTSGGTTGSIKTIRAINLSYSVVQQPSSSLLAKDNFNDTNEADKDGQTAASGGYRKCVIRDNLFHLRKNAICIEVFTATGSPSSNNNCYGLLITGNMNDVGGTLLRTTNSVKLVGAVVSNNTSFRSVIPHVHIDANSLVESMSITGNFFGGTDTELGSTNGVPDVSDDWADGVKVDSEAIMRRSTISGNTFLRPADACINLGHSTNNAIVGNTFSKDDRNNIPALYVVGSGVIVGNTSNCDTFITGSTGSWTQSANRT